MRLLFLHPNMPGQYKHLAVELARRPGHQVVFLTEARVDRTLPGVKKITYQPPAKDESGVHRYVRPLQRSAYLSQELFRLCRRLKQGGFTPDVIIGHLGWGQGLYLKDVYPDTPILSFFEYFYGVDHTGSNFLPGEELDMDAQARTRTLNAQHLLNLTYSDWGITPTYFQYLRHPPEWRSKMSLLHDGVDTEAVRPATTRRGVQFGENGPSFKPGDEVVTYVSRNFEPFRGFPTFMRAAEILLKKRPNCRIVCIGSDEVSYGRKLPPGVHYRQLMRQEVDLDPERIHFVGRLPHAQMVRMMQLSAAHIYLTVPFVLSWSMLEAMAAGCLIIGSDTPPVREVIEDGVNGLLTDFFDAEALADKVADAIEKPGNYVELRRAARRTVLERYALDRLLPFHIGLVEDLANGGPRPDPSGNPANSTEPPPTHHRITAYNALYDIGTAQAYRRMYDGWSWKKPDGEYIPGIVERIQKVMKEREQQKPDKPDEGMDSKADLGEDVAAGDEDLAVAGEAPQTAAREDGIDTAEAT